ncbi:eukaryotic aspartyl protease family protein [Striga asiatica]|uniref:Eukaryotic aspartyl protease family protein n=1 Tax=Striga asiatica TaxID=4170 RepID=A0A5A7QAA5_STRAF|nr:eukaryotic aspartyl protease family protein [Striga asiatica]
MACSSQCYLSLFLFLLALFFTLSSSHSITLSLSYPTKSTAIDSVWQQLRQTAVARSGNIASTTPLFANSDGMYTFSLAFGTPTQYLMFALVSGGVFTSFPCGANFLCVNCTIDPKDILIFKPDQSNTSSPVYCDNPLLSKTVSLDLVPVCTECISNDSCSNARAEYADDEGSVTMSGYILSESLTLPELNHPTPDLLVGCASESEGPPEGIGIAGFGRVPSSLPSQLNLTKFSHCFVLNTYEDNRNVSGALVLTWGEEEEEDSRYTPLIKVTNETWENTGYLVNIEKIMVGGVKVEVPTEYLTVNETSGNGGMMVEAGYTISVMVGRVFASLAREFEKQVGKKYTRAVEMENESSFYPCYYVKDSAMKGLPELGFHFEGGAELDMPLENYFEYFNESVICMTIWSYGNETTTDALEGPAMVLGQRQMQNVYVDYDLANNRLGFFPKNCSQGSY